MSTTTESRPDGVRDRGPDPVTFEIIRHRLTSINEEAAASIARMAGSTVVTEATDMNSGLMLADGTVVVFGLYVLVHSLSLNTMVRDVIENYSENPGIGPGDMFMSNDPYITGSHQLDATLVSPVYAGGERIAWTATIVHQSDVGGPSPGSYNVAAETIFEEAVPMVPMKIVEAGVIRRDVEREWLVRTRTPDLNRLDLLGQIAANRLFGERVLELCDRYGVDAVTGTLNRLVSGTETRLRRRLSELPDGVWRYGGYNDHDGVEDKDYPVRLVMTKTGDRLVLDFTESPTQVRAMTNTRGLKSWVGGALMPVLGFDGLAWVPGAFEKVVELRTRPGSILDVQWPAAVNGGGTFSGQEARTAVNICLSRLFDTSEAFADQVVASCQCSSPGQIASGHHANGAYFTVTMLDAQGGGSGATVGADGCDVSGPIHAPGGACANVESNEHAHGIRYLWRRETPDSGGPGRRRGGAGSTFAYTPHGTRGPVDLTLFAHAVRQPASSGVLGGEPGSQHGFLIVRQADEVALRRATTAELAAMGEVPAPKSKAWLEPGDVLISWVSGGGGVGDPLDRPPADVAHDVHAGLVTAEGAVRDYGVVVSAAPAERDGGDAEPGMVKADIGATEQLRHSLRAQRLAGSAPAPRRAAGVDGRRMTSDLVLQGGSGNEPTVACRRCGHQLGRAAANPKLSLVMEERPVDRRWPLAARYDNPHRFVVRHLFCPGCAQQLDVEVNLRTEPVVWSQQLDVS